MTTSRTRSTKRFVCRDRARAAAPPRNRLRLRASSDGRRPMPRADEANSASPESSRSVDVATRATIASGVADCERLSTAHWPTSSRTRRAASRCRALGSPDAAALKPLSASIRAGGAFRSRGSLQGSGAIPGSEAHERSERTSVLVSGVVFALVTRTARGFMSNARARRPRATASTTDVPPPTKGSRTTSPNEENSSITAPTKSGENLAGYR